MWQELCKLPPTLMRRVCCVPSARVWPASRATCGVTTLRVGGAKVVLSKTRVGRDSCSAMSTQVILLDSPQRPSGRARASAPLISSVLYYLSCVGRYRTIIYRVSLCSVRILHTGTLHGSSRTPRWERRGGGRAKGRPSLPGPEVGVTGVK